MVKSDKRLQVRPQPEQRLTPPAARGTRVTLRLWRPTARTTLQPATLTLADSLTLSLLLDGGAGCIGAGSAIAPRADGLLVFNCMGGTAAEKVLCVEWATAFYGGGVDN